MAKINPPLRPETVPVPDAVLRRHGWLRVEADLPEEGSFRSLLSELRGEKAIHSWRWLAPRAGLREVLAAEARLRPTVVFGYYAVRRDGSRELVAAAAASERVNAGFPLDGFPVLARGFVRRPYRGGGLYAATLAHRLERCRRAWGGDLEAVHLGTANPRVQRVLAREGRSLDFRPIGRELLKTGRRRTVVRDYAAFTPAFARRLRTETAPHPALAGLVARLLERGFDRRGYARLADAWEDAGRPSPALGRLLALFAAIPVESRAGAGRVRKAHPPPARLARPRGPVRPSQPGARSPTMTP